MSTLLLSLIMKIMMKHLFAGNSPPVKRNVMTGDPLRP